MRIKIEVTETTLRTFELEGVSEEKAIEIMSTLYKDFAVEGKSPEHGKNMGYSFQIRSTAQMPPTLKYETCQACEGTGGFPYFMKMEKKINYAMVCTECNGQGVVADSPLKVEISKEKENA